ncbi:MAG: serine/threonine protein kinase, partial [marine benthic group bacterium]|nr:serine/threonine protein kinase [Gemmatimonadota bacterium]
MTSRKLQERASEVLRERYRITEEIGRGGTAVVFGGEDLRHGREVAIKVLHPEVSAVLGRERFLQEIQIAAQLAHPHILPLYDSGESDGLLYHVSPLLEGETLRERLDRERMLPVEEALRIGGEILDGLGCAHRSGIVHRDIKPANILLSGNHALVSDFGVARALERGGGARLTATGVVVGTPAYMSPEQAGGEPLDARSDLYAAACVIWEMLCGETPMA